MERRYARFARGGRPIGPGESPAPADGMCLNAFLVLTPPRATDRVLLGRIAPGPAWEEAGGLDPARMTRIADRWMLPASQLLLFESPLEASRRIAHELLGLGATPLEGPRIFSETYARPESGTPDPHWDLHFVFTGKGPAEPPAHPLWRELAYVPIADLPRAAFARGHGDVLELVGLPPSDPPTGR